MFCIMIFLSIPFTFFFLPEVCTVLIISKTNYQHGLLTFFQTSGKTLEEMDYIFSKRPPFDNSSGVETPSEKNEKAAVQFDA